MHNPPYLTPLTLGALLLGAALNSPAAAQNPGQWSKFRAHVAPDTWSRFGETCCSVGDVNGDGTADYLVGALNASDLSGQLTGAVHLYSGADGSLIRNHYGTEASSLMGFDLAAMGDLNGDGIDDYAVSESCYPDLHGLDLAYVYVYSGADGSVIHSWNYDGYGTDYGDQIENIGDWTGDGINDIAIAAPGAGTKGLGNTGIIFLHSGADGSLIRTIEGNATEFAFGQTLHAPGDVDGDGYNDLLVKCIRLQGYFIKGRVLLFSGRTQQRIATIDSPHHHHGGSNSFGSAMVAVGEWTGDQSLEIAISDPLTDGNGGEACGVIWVFNGSSGEIVHEIHGHATHRWLGLPLAAVGDINGDGFRDFGAGQYGSGGGINSMGAAMFISGADGAIVKRLSSDVKHGRFGRSIADATDLDGDGRDEVLIGAPGIGGGNHLPELQVWSWNP